MYSKCMLLIKICKSIRFDPDFSQNSGSQNSDKDARIVILLRPHAKIGLYKEDSPLQETVWSPILSQACLQIAEASRLLLQMQSSPALSILFAFEMTQKRALALWERRSGWPHMLAYSWWPFWGSRISQDSLEYGSLKEQASHSA